MNRRDSEMNRRDSAAVLTRAGMHPEANLCLFVSVRMIAEQSALSADSLGFRSICHGEQMQLLPGLIIAESGKTRLRVNGQPA